ncbi:MAG: aminotransferase class V-fold PLP-dependent enzyme [Anaerolineae bacterium]|nr:aminotransferase class V-fold PLP-dependent enzyme [Anaerolineae bacterium]
MAERQLKAVTMDIYEELGVKKIINGAATLTMLGGSLMPPEVLDAMSQAAKHFVNMDELHEKVGAKIAEWTHNEAAYVTCGAAAGLALSTAACITGLDPVKRAKLPNTKGMKNQIIVHKCGRVGYDFAIRQAGGQLLPIGSDSGASANDLLQAINEKTAAIFYFYNASRMQGQVPMEKAIAIAKEYQVPLVVDAAAQIPPVDNLWRFTSMGADLALFSGGKGLQGPQSSGLMLGRQELIEAAAFNACPRAFIGRPMKVGKEELVGLMTAVRWYLDLDHEALMQSYEDQVQQVIDSLDCLAGVHVTRGFPSEAGQPMPRADVQFDPEVLVMNRDAIQTQLREGDPCIYLANSGKDGIFVNPQTLREGEVEIIIQRISDIVKRV